MVNSTKKNAVHIRLINHCKNTQATCGTFADPVPPKSVADPTQFSDLDPINSSQFAGWYKMFG